MTLSADDDVAQATMKKWYGDAELPGSVPGGLQRGRLTSFQPNVQADNAEQAPSVPNKRVWPYATFAVAKLEAGLHDTGNVYVDRRLVTIEVRGTHQHVQDVMPMIRTAFNRKRLETLAPFLSCLQDDDPDITEDPARAEGEDVWIGSAKLHVTTDRDE